jgi:hypothetical protein
MGCDVIVRNEKYLDDGIVYYRMRRGDCNVMVAVSPTELEIGRDVVARRLMLARARLAHLRAWGLLR